MLREMLINNIHSQAGTDKGGFVEVGYGQVEPNHLSAQYNGQIYAQLPAAADIEVLEQGQFVKYDYANEAVNFTGPGEWMLVYNEIKLYREGQLDCEFAMLKDNYQARVYSPLDGGKAQDVYGPTRFLQGKREKYNGSTFKSIENITDAGDFGGADMEAVATKSYDYYEMDDVNNPAIKDEVRKRLFMKLRDYEEKMMPKGTSMVPRVLKTMPGDIYTTNFVKEAALEVGDFLTPGEHGILAKAGAGTETPTPGVMVWQVVKVYTMPDMQKGVKLMRVQ